MRVFFDTEFTGLHQNTTLISIGFVTEEGNTFYAEFIDYDKNQVDEWIQENVIANLVYGGSVRGTYEDAFSKMPNISMSGHTQDIVEELTSWIEKLGAIEIWSDCLSY